MLISDYIKLFKLITNTGAETESGKYLIDHHKTLSIAESCTGGLVSSLMTDISGSSNYIKANFVTYANEAKMKYLKVKEETLQKHGAVSKETAHEMVQGLLDNTASDFALATTGIAGPDGGTAAKPVGLVYIGIGKQGCINVYKYNAFPKSPRILIKYMFAKQAVLLLYEFLKGIKK